MSRDWEGTFRAWAQGPSTSEQERADNAERQIKEAVAASPKLQHREIRVFTQGSYRNRVNVRRDSDVDVGVLCFDSYFADYPDDNIKLRMAESELPANYVYSSFKNDLEEALVARFGRDSVTRGQKAFDVKANTYRVEADVAAFFEHRRYTSINHYISGVELRPDSTPLLGIRNWPEQHYANGVMKNDRTGRRFKRVVRILKSLANEMSVDGVTSARRTPSFLVECLAWNTPDERLTLPSYSETVRAALAHLFNETIADQSCAEWGEVSELKYLFRASQPWTRQGAHQFISDAWDYLGLQ